MEGSLSGKHSILPLVNNGTAEKRFKFFCRFFRHIVGSGQSDCQFCVFFAQFHLDQ